MRLPVDIDGSLGEGGGQVLRTALALSLITGRTLRLRNIRARRGNPGLQRQHLACIEAAAKLGGATARPIGGGELRAGCDTLEFAPAAAWASEVAVDIGSAGSTTLVVQTILIPALVASDRPLRAVITGGTHNPLAPPFEFLDRVFLPPLRAMGADATVTLERHGVLPDGGGRIVLETRPSQLKPIALVETGAVVARRVTAVVAGLPRHIADRELAVARERLREPACSVVEIEDAGPHNLFMVEAELASGARELTTAHGRKGYPAEDVAADALDDLVDFLEAGVPVGDYLADQLLLPMAVAGGGRFRTTELSLHATTNIQTIAAFLDTPIKQREIDDDIVEVSVG